MIYLFVNQFNLYMLLLYWLLIVKNIAKNILISLYEW